MIKPVYGIAKRPGLTGKEFFHYWKIIHGAIGARIPRLRRLVQSLRITVPGDKRPDYDGVSELWFDDIESLLKACQSPEWKASSEDEKNFIDHNKVAYFVSKEHVIFERVDAE
jgi:uncharacterized protein (TIGR02118 family)